MDITINTNSTTLCEFCKDANATYLFEDAGREVNICDKCLNKFMKRLKQPARIKVPEAYTATTTEGVQEKYLRGEK